MLLKGSVDRFGEGKADPERPTSTRSTRVTGEKPEERGGERHAGGGAGGEGEMVRRPQRRADAEEELTAARLSRDAIVVGGGHNGLVAAAYLAKVESPKRLRAACSVLMEMTAGREKGVRVREEAPRRRSCCDRGGHPGVPLLAGLLRILALPPTDHQGPGSLPART